MSEEDDMTPDESRRFNEMADRVEWLTNEFSQRRDNLMGLKDAQGNVYNDTLAGQIGYARAESWHGMQAARQAVAEIGAWRAADAANASGNLTPEQVTAAAKDGALAALDERIESARVEITPKET